MKEVLRSNNAVWLSFSQALLQSEGIESVIMDTHASIMDGSIGALPRRLMVATDDLERALVLIENAEREHNAGGG
ncbi:MAG: DUF2007 domain-containing protein [Parvibaculales bacterium]